MRIAIAEDEAPQRALLCEYVQAYAESQNLPLAISEFADGTALAGGYEPGTDVLFADIDMPGMSGMEAAKIIRARDERVMIVFCTNLVARALDGYAVQALDFIVKPFGPERIAQALEKARRYLALRAPKTFTLRAQDGLVNLSEADILYAETYARKLLVHTASGTVETRMPISMLEQQLTPGTFFRVHNAYLVSLRHVGKISGSEMTIRGETIPVSRHKKRELIRALTTYWGEQL